jgi:hypothetical protein
LFFLLLLFYLLCSPASGLAAERTYQITETELTRLDEISRTRQVILGRLTDTLEALKLNENEAKTQLVQALTDLRTMKSELEILRM